MAETTQLLTLPNEIVRHICANFCRHCTRFGGGFDLMREPFIAHDWEGLHYLSQTCRVLRDIAQPMLYHSIGRHRPVPLLRTLIARPDLAAAVCSISNEHAYDGDHLLPDDIVWIKAAAERVGITLPVVWPIASDDAGSGIFDLVLAHLPGLEAVDYVIPYERNPGVGLRGSGKVTLAALRRLRINHYDTEGAFELGPECEILDHAPRLESLTTHLCGDVEAGMLLPNVTSLVFDFGYLSPGHLINAIDMCPQLEEFSYHSAGATVGQYEDEDEFSPGDAVRVLRTRKATLKHLDLDFGQLGDEYLLSFEEDLSERQQMGSLADFTKLESLIMRPSYMCSCGEAGSFANSEKLIQSLPKSLVQLGLADGNNSFESPVRLAEAVRDGRLPNLKKVAVSAPAEEMKRLKEEFAAVGVECETYSEGGIPTAQKHRRWPGF